MVFFCKYELSMNTSMAYSIRMKEQANVCWVLLFCCACLLLDSALLCAKTSGPSEIPKNSKKKQNKKKWISRVFNFANDKLEKNSRVFIFAKRPKIREIAKFYTPEQLEIDKIPLQWRRKDQILYDVSLLTTTLSSKNDTSTDKNRICSNIALQKWRHIFDVKW